MYVVLRSNFKQSTWNLTVVYRIAIIGRSEFWHLEKENYLLVFVFAKYNFYTAPDYSHAMILNIFLELTLSWTTEMIKARKNEKSFSIEVKMLGWWRNR